MSRDDNRTLFGRVCALDLDKDAILAPWVVKLLDGDELLETVRRKFRCDLLDLGEQP